MTDRPLGTGTKPVFMSPDHVNMMNVLLAQAPTVHLACAKLQRRYTMSYELHDGPDGSVVHWSMTLDPKTGVRMGLAKVDQADVTFVGDWSRVLRASAAHRRGEQADPGVEVHGDADVVQTVADACAAAQQVAAVDVEFPDIDG